MRLQSHATTTRLYKEACVGTTRLKILTVSTK